MGCNPRAGINLTCRPFAKDLRPFKRSVFLIQSMGKLTSDYTVRTPFLNIFVEWPQGINIGTYAVQKNFLI